MTSAVLEREGTPAAEVPTAPMRGGPGRTRIAARALEQVAVAVAAEALGVAAGRVRVELVDDAGSLALVVTSPIRAVPLRRGVVGVGTVADAVSRSGGSILDRAAAATTTIGATVEALCGSNVSRVSLRVSGLDNVREGRVL